MYSLKVSVNHVNADATDETKIVTTKFALGFCHGQLRFCLLVRIGPKAKRALCDVAQFVAQHFDHIMTGIVVDKSTTLNHIRFAFFTTISKTMK